MENLVGSKESDKFIQKEFEKAKIPFEKVDNPSGECQYTLVGKLNGWIFTRAWYYWCASTEGEGIPLETALEMHNKKYPDEMFDHYHEYRIYGNSIRVEGHCGCPSPDEYCKGQSSVTLYHIDTQEGLNEFVRVIKKL